MSGGVTSTFEAVGAVFPAARRIPPPKVLMRWRRCSYTQSVSTFRHIKETCRKW
jgi:hypothetical protein